TGWAQIRRGYVHDLPGEVEKMHYDLYYIAHLSLWLDLKILFETARVVIFQALEDDLLQPSAEDTNKVSASSGYEDLDRGSRDLARIEFGAAVLAASTDGRSGRAPDSQQLPPAAGIATRSREG